MILCNFLFCPQVSIVRPTLFFEFRNSSSLLPLFLIDRIIHLYYKIWVTFLLVFARFDNINLET